MMHAWWAPQASLLGADTGLRSEPEDAGEDAEPAGAALGADDELRPLNAPPTAGEQRRFERYAGEIMAIWTPRTAALLALAALAFWPFDWVVSPALRPALGAMRVHALICTGAVVFLATFTGWATRAPRLFASVASIGGVTVLGWSMSSVGDLSTPWFHYITTISALSAVIPVALGPRFVLALGHAAGLVAGYFLPHLEYLDHRYAGVGLSQALFGAGVAVVVGHGFYTLLRRGHVQGQRLAVQGAHLAHARATLEARVAEQTRELRLLARHLDEAVSAERRELAQEIHDRLGQELTALHYVLAAARRRTEGASRPLATAVDEADHLVGRTRVTMRRILARLGPQALERLGLVGAVRWAAEDFTKRVGLTTSVDIAPEAALMDAIPAGARVLFSAATEGLNNVARHAQAHQVWVTMGPSGAGVASPTAAWGGSATSLSLTIRDDGGPRPLALPPSNDDAGEGPAETLGEGLGLIALRERAVAAGGGARWGPHPDGGFELQVTVPLPNPTRSARDASSPEDET